MAAQDVPQHEIIRLEGGSFGFVVADEHKGVVPEILENLLAERREVKALLRDERDEVMRTILDLRQKAIKIAANAFYGFLGAQTSRLRCLPIAECTLGLGRAMLEQAQRFIESDDGRDTPHLPRTRAKVIYGDTDSVFVAHKGAQLTVEQAIEKGRAAAAMVSRRIDRKPVLLEYEKTYGKWLSQELKRYAGAVVAEGGGAEQEVDIKGFECQRRDTPPYIERAVRNVLHAVTIGDGPRAARRAAAAAIHDVMGRRHHAQDLAHTTALKMWESAAQSSPAKSKKKAAKKAKDETELYTATTAHTFLAKQIQDESGGMIFFESGQRISYVYCAPKAQDAQRASTAKKRPPLFRLATDPFDTLVQGRSIDWDEALRQLEMPLKRIFDLPGMLGTDSRAPHSWEMLLQSARAEFEREARVAPWRATHTSGGGGGGSVAGGAAAKGTLGSFFKVAKSSRCVICNGAAGGGVCSSGECVSQVAAVRSALQGLVQEAQQKQQVCVAEWKSCLGGCDGERWAAATASGAKGGGQQPAARSPLAGCENQYSSLPFRMAFALQAERRWSERLERLGPA